MNIETFNALDETAKFAATMFAYVPYPLNSTSVGILLKRRFGVLPVSVESVKFAASVINSLETRKLIQKTDSYSLDYVNRAEYPTKTLVKVLRDAEGKGWLPNLDDLRQALAYAKSGTTQYGRFSLQAECARLVAVGSGAEMFERLAKSLAVSGGLAIARGAVWHAAGIIEDEPDFMFTGNGDPLVRVMRYWLNIRFLQGRDVRKALVALEAAFRTGGKWDWRLVTSFAALCFWIGWRQGLDTAFAVSASQPPQTGGRYDEDADEVFHQTLNACRFAMDGDFASADIAFKIAEKFDDDLDGQANVECRQVDNVPERLLAAMCAAAANPDKIAKRRPASVMDQTWYGDRMWCDDDCPEERYADYVERISESFASAWKNVVTGRGSLISKYRRDSSLSVLGGLTWAWDFRLCVKGRSKLRDKVENLIALAKEAERAGYVNIAQLYLTLLSGGYDEAGLADLLKRVSVTSVKFLPDTSQKDEWKNILDIMRKTVKGASKVVKHENDSRGVRVFWHLAAEKPTKEGLLELRYLEPVLRPASEPVGSDRFQQLSRYEIESKKTVRRLFSEKDMAIVHAVSASGGSMSRKTCGEVLPMLVGMENVELRFFGENATYYNSKLTNPKPVKVVAGKCEMRSTVSADGGVVLSVPKWTLENTEDAVLVLVDDETIAVVKLSDGHKRLLSMFRDIGVGGKITLPPQAMKEAAPVIEDMATLLPVAAPTAKEKTRLRRVAAATSLAARLSFAGDALTVRIVAKPLAAMPSLAIEPGEGQAERVVADASGNYLLVRDLAAEKEALERVKSALAECETWFDGESSWNIDDIPAALGALGALKAMADAEPSAFALEWIDDKKVSVTFAPKSGVHLGSARTAEDWFRVDGEFALDDGRVLSVAKFLDAARARVGDYVKLSDGDYVRLTKTMARQIDALAAAGRRKGDGVEIPKAAIPMLDGAFGEGDDSLELPDAMAKTAEEIRTEFARKPTVPRALSAELRPYQLEGYRWLSRLAGCGFGSCLADDMGLGKTVQVIALLLERAKGGASLVMAPSSVCGNWRSEIRRFAPSLRPQMAYENEGALASFGPSDVVIASYGYLLFHEDEFAAVKWNGVVLDEAQAVKNDASKRAKAVKRLPSKFRVAATGTPVENRLGELWSIFDFLNPGLLGAASSFASRFTSNGMATGTLKRLVKPLVLRRLKGEVLDDLPEKTESTVMVELGKAERSAYEGCRVHALQQLEKDAEMGGGEVNRMSILAELTRLRRFCCHPSLVLPNEALPSAKMEALLELLSNLRDSRHRALVFSQFTDYLAIVRKALDARGWTHLYLDGSTPTAERGRLVEAFQSGEGDFFVISLKAGGTGLNLTAADYVILLDPWWNPAVENQAADRAHRIGQRNPVTVYRLIAADTVEERVLELHKEKKQIAEDVLDGTGSAALSPAQLMGLFKSNATDV